MIKKTILIFTLFLTTLTAQANFSTYKTTVLKADKNIVTITDSNNFSIGSSGVIMHSFDSEHSTIIATVEVIEKKSGYALLKYENFKGLKQSALPSYNIKPQKGDEVILNFLYDRAMAIVPNKDTLRYITQKYSDIEWIHPDIFASKLAIEYTPVPEKKDFKHECRQDNFALLFFAIEDKGYFVDCNSFKVLHQVNLSQTNREIKVPFYSRLKEIKGRMFGLMGGDGIKDYDRYYKKLLGL
jgi:hypothetical protein